MSTSAGSVNIFRRTTVSRRSSGSGLPAAPESANSRTTVQRRARSPRRRSKTTATITTYAAIRTRYAAEPKIETAASTTSSTVQSSTAPNISNMMSRVFSSRCSCLRTGTIVLADRRSVDQARGCDPRSERIGARTGTIGSADWLASSGTPGALALSKCQSWPFAGHAQAALWNSPTLATVSDASRVRVPQRDPLVTRGTSFARRPGGATSSTAIGSIYGTPASPRGMRLDADVHLRRRACSGPGPWAGRDSRVG